MLKEYKFELSDPIQYHKIEEGSADIADSSTIVLYAPSRKQLRSCTALKQYFFASMRSEAQTDRGDDTSKDRKEDLSGEDVITMMYLSGGADMNGVLDEAARLFISGVAKIDGAVPLTTAHLDLMTLDDIERMLGEYMVNFILASFLLSMKNA